MFQSQYFPTQWDHLVKLSYHFSNITILSCLQLFLNLRFHWMNYNRWGDLGWVHWTMKTCKSGISKKSCALSKSHTIFWLGFGQPFLFEFFSLWVIAPKLQFWFWAEVAKRVYCVSKQAGKQLKSVTSPHSGYHCSPTACGNNNYMSRHK